MTYTWPKLFRDFREISNQDARNLLILMVLRSMYFACTLDNFYFSKYKQAATKLKTYGKEKDSQIHELQKTVSRFTENEVKQQKKEVSEINVQKIDNTERSMFCLGFLLSRGKPIL